MDAIRQFIDVKDHTFQVILPDGFNARRVEVIILPSDERNQLSNETKKMLDERLEEFHKNPNDVFDFEQLLENLKNEI